MKYLLIILRCYHSVVIWSAPAIIDFLSTKGVWLQKGTDKNTNIHTHTHTHLLIKSGEMWFDYRLLVEWKHQILPKVGWFTAQIGIGQDASSSQMLNSTLQHAGFLWNEVPVHDNKIKFIK